MKKVRAACIQINASENFDDNILHATALAAKAARQRARWIAFPENFLWRGSSKDLKKIALKTLQAVRHFQSMAANAKVTLLLGSLLESSPVKKKYYNTSFLISSSGQIAAKYRKIHLFEIGLRNVRTKESRHIEAGSNPVTGSTNGIKVGLTICYDLRFPELYRRLTDKDASVITVPANFTAHTGKAHWETLIRARAIENQVFILAPAQVGANKVTKMMSFGNSLMVDPWGKILAKGSSDSEEIILADLDFEFQKKLRRQFPVLEHRKI